MKKRFTEQQIKTARAKVKSGADFPREIREFKEMGIICYEFLVEDGVCVYFGEEGYSLRTESDYRTFPYKALNVNLTSSAQKLMAAIRIHQQGNCVQAAISGVDRWRCDLIKMTCTYLDSEGKEMLQEPIPAGDY